MDLTGSWRQLLASGVRHARPIVTALLVRTREHHARRGYPRPPSHVPPFYMAGTVHRHAA